MEDKINIKLNRYHSLTKRQKKKRRKLNK